jgi:hypothetical protein
MVFSERLAEYTCVMEKLLNAEHTLLFEYILYQNWNRRKSVIVPDMIRESLNRPKIMHQISSA